MKTMIQLGIIYIPIAYVSSASADISLTDFSVRKIVKSQQRLYSDELTQMLYAYTGPLNNNDTNYWAYTDAYVQKNTTTEDYEWIFTNHYLSVRYRPSIVNL